MLTKRIMALAVNEISSEIASKYSDICRELNMDKETEKNSWTSYEQVYKNFTLEGDPRHWFCCSLYTACRESFTPTVGISSTVVKGNCVSLTKLLRSCHISIHDFFAKIKKWIDVTNSPQYFLNQVERLERSFGVSFVLYQKYSDTFEKLFVISSTSKKHKKSKPGKCSASKLYEFCWCLFLCAKGEDPKHTVDIVTSFHLLLCCIDLVYLNALDDKRDDVINLSFPGIPKKSNKIECDTTNSSTSSSSSSSSVLTALCEMHDVKFTDANDMKHFSFKTIMEKFISTKTIQGKGDTFMGIISNNSFEPNSKSLNNTYEQYVLSVGEFDERMFISNVAFKKLDANADRTIKSLVPPTPLTRKHLLPYKDSAEPISTATQNVKKLHNISLKTCKPEFLRNAEKSISDKLEDLIGAIHKTFCNKYPTKPEAEKRFELAKGVYYYLLEKIVKAELKAKPNLDFQTLLQSQELHVSLLVCCVEIVIVAHNSHLKFPWVLECFELQPFHFYKIIEIVVSRHEDALTRSLIKHLNTIEEKCLDSLVWRNNSVLWDIIKQRDNEFPSWISVDSKNAANNTGITNMKNLDSINLEKSLLLSPANSAYEYFKQSSSNESARRDLFNAGKANVETVKPATENNVSKGAGSFALFCRKFYKLAYMRISELCKELNLRDDENLAQIWTIFEYSVVQTTELLQDRHLDQIIMCAIYVFIKVKDIRDKTFTDIMRYYRNQSQAASHIYRDVLIQPAIKTDNGGTTAASFNDIIYFYNHVYVQKMTPYALEFGDKTKSKSNLLLSPHPPEKVPSPKQLLFNHHLYIQPLEKTHVSHSPNSVTYEFCRSPAKDLEKINQLVRCGKRNLPFNDDDGVPIKSQASSRGTIFIPRKMHDIIREKQSDGNRE